MRIEERYTIEYDRLNAMAAELVHLPVAAIMAGGSAVAGLAAKSTTSTIPIVFACLEDPVRAGLVDDLHRPSANVTGVSFFAGPLEQKRMELLSKLLPTARRIGALVNRTLSDNRTEVGDLEAAARALDQEIILISASSVSEIENAFSTLVERRADAMIVGSDPFLFSRRNQLVAMAARFRIPAIYNVRQYVEAGGLLSYGVNVAEIWYQAGVYVGRILKGAEPRDLPVLLPTRYEFMVNFKTANALGLTVPPSLLATVDEVIE